jgi:hypothetical protein
MGVPTLPSITETAAPPSGRFAFLSREAGIRRSGFPPLDPSQRRGTSLKAPPAGAATPLRPVRLSRGRAEADSAA